MEQANLTSGLRLRSNSCSQQITPDARSVRFIFNFTGMYHYVLFPKLLYRIFSEKSSFYFQATQWLLVWNWHPKNFPGFWHLFSCSRLLGQSHNLLLFFPLLIAAPEKKSKAKWNCSILTHICIGLDDSRGDIGHCRSHALIRSSKNWSACALARSFG